MNLIHRVRRIAAAIIMALLVAILAPAHSNAADPAPPAPAAAVDRTPAVAPDDEGRTLTPAEETAVFGAPASREAVDRTPDNWCFGQWQLRGDPWHQKMPNHLPNPLGGLPLPDTYDGRLVLVYRFCPNIDGPRKIDPIAIKARVSDIYYHHSYERTKFDVVVTEIDSERDIDPGPFSLWDNGTDKIKKTKVIKDPIRRALDMAAGPAWHAGYLNINNNWGDAGGVFLGGDGSPVNYVHPDASTTWRFSGWQW